MFIGATAVASIPIASTVVVVVVAKVISDPSLVCATGLAPRVSEGNVEAFTVSTVVVLHVSSTTVPSVPVAGTNVVYVVTICISLPCRLNTCGIQAIVVAGEVWIEAVALVAICCQHLSSAAVSSVPAAQLDVVLRTKCSKVQ